MNYFFQSINRSLLSIILTLFFTTLSFARDYRPEEIVNPNIANRFNYIADPENRMSQAAKESVNRELYQLRLNTDAEVAVAVVPSIGDMDISSFAEKVFTSWGLGKADRDNGLLILIALQQREAFIATGYGVEGIIPDISAKAIIDTAIVPNMKNGDLDAAVSDAVSTVFSALSDPEVAEELKSKHKDAWEESYESLNSETLIGFIVIVALGMFFVSIGLFFNDTFLYRKKDRIAKAQNWHKHKSTYLLLAFGSLGLGFLTYLLAERKRKKSREEPMECPCCHEKMHKLSEEEDNSMLTPSQDFEERLNTVDYDVWVCPRCGSIEKYPFKINQKKYSECPSCHTVAMYMMHDHTITPATTYRQGIGERVYECLYCKNRKKEQYTIPRKQDNSALAAGAAGSLLGGGRGHGGGFGGGFGGGRTGGGGAGGRW